MWMLISIFILLSYTLINIYNGIKILALIRYFFPLFRAVYFWPVFIFLCYSMILVFVFRLNIFHSLRNAALFQIPAMLYLCFSLLILSVLLAVIKITGIVNITPGLYAVRTGIALVVTVMIMIYGHFHAKDIKTVHYSVSLNTANVNQETGNTLRIALIADTHIGGNTDKKWLARIVDTVNETRPDIICLAGDVFDTDIRIMPDREAKIAELRRLSAPLGVYAVPGNHDVDRIAFRDGGVTEGIREILENAGIVFLQDEVHLIDGKFYLIGRRDMSPIGGRQDRKSALELVEGLDKSMPFIVMDHQPMDYRNLEEAGADPILSGHTHRGQFFPGNLATNIIFRKAGALNHGHWKGPSAQGIITSGAGVWGLVFRLGSNSEVVVIDVNL